MIFFSNGDKNYSRVGWRPWRSSVFRVLVTTASIKHRLQLYLENIADLGFQGGLKMLSTRLDSIKSTRIVQIESLFHGS